MKAPSFVGNLQTDASRIAENLVQVLLLRVLDLVFSSIFVYHISGDATQTQICGPTDPPVSIGFGR